MSRKNKRQKYKTTDAFSNPAARLGINTLDLLQATQYVDTRLTQDYALLTTLYRGNWIVQNIINTIPDDVVRKWYEIKSSISPDLISSMTQLERRTAIKSRILQGMYWGRLYGGAAGLIMIKGNDNLSDPLDYDTIMPDSFLGLHILDRWSGIYPEGGTVINPSDLDFGLPDFYTVRDEETGRTVATVHHSRIIRFTGRELPWLEKINEMYWGESEIEAIYEEVVKRDNVSGNIAGLTFRANLNYLVTDGLDQMLGIGNSKVQQMFWQRLQAQAIIESNFGTRVINKGDEVKNIQYTFTGLPEVYDRMMMDVAGAARTPVTKLFGRSPAGMNATGESDLQNYYDYIDGKRETEFRPIIERLLPIMAISAWGEIPSDMEISFPAIWTPKAQDIAKISADKTSAILSAYQVDLIDSATAQKELKSLSEETGMFASISDESIEAGKGVTYSSQKSMHDPFAGLTIPNDFESGGIDE